MKRSLAAIAVLVLIASASARAEASLESRISDFEFSIAEGRDGIAELATEQRAIEDALAAAGNEASELRDRFDQAKSILAQLDEPVERARSEHASPRAEVKARAENGHGRSGKNYPGAAADRRGSDGRGFRAR